MIAALGLTGAVAGAAPQTDLGWADMPDPAAQVFEDPFRDLSPEQFDDLRFAVRLRSRLAQDVGRAEERQKWRDLLTETEAALAQDDIDVDRMLSQREVVIQRRINADTAGNPRIDGQVVTIAGYAIPAPPDADGRPVAYLVPQPGMCSHLPPPPANQMIRVLLTRDWTPEYVHEPVRLTGKLTIDPSDREMNVVDGLVLMQATFKLDATDAMPIDQTDDERARVQDMIDRLRAGAHRKTGGSQPQN